MAGTCFLLRRGLCVLAVVCAFGSRDAQGLILHPDQGSGEQVPAGEHPSNAVMARWSGYASAVIISPMHAITTCHQGGGIGSKVEVEGVWYRVDQYYPHPQADLRIVLLENGGQLANFTEYVDVYRGLDERSRVAVIGGWGAGRGADLVSNNIVYGYAWGSGPNTVLRWGSNLIDSYGYGGGNWITRTLKADFDGVGQGGYVAHEAGAADMDSGGGWFLQDGGVWKLAGLSRTAERLGETWFLNKYDLPAPRADAIDAVRVGEYAAWVDYILAGPVPGDSNLDGRVGIADLTALADHYGMAGPTLNWTDGDFNDDGVVGIADLVALAGNYGLDMGVVAAAGAAPPADSVPEPATALLLIAGVTMIVRRNSKS